MQEREAKILASFDLETLQECIANLGPLPLHDRAAWLGACSFEQSLNATVYTRRHARVLDEYQCAAARDRLIKSSAPATRAAWVAASQSRAFLDGG